jgi:superfamily II DNA or RNA helicase
VLGPSISDVRGTRTPACTISYGNISATFSRSAGGTEPIDLATIWVATPVITPYHARYFAYELTRQAASDGVDRLSRALFDASVDLNPHQIEAALFALRSPLSKGVLLADEVGLGKTIEAALVLCQLWAERKRRLLVICPASLRKQWSLELEEKLNLPTVVIDKVGYDAARAEGHTEPFRAAKVVITSLNYANTMRADIRAIPWDLVVIDEAHKLRNAYRASNVIGQGIRWAIEDRKKLLVTATPLQNSLLELYGLTTLIDEQIFGDPATFRSMYATAGADLSELAARLRPFCKRTLRKQVVEYIQYTERRAMTRPFHPTDQEHELYEAISAFLRRTDSYALPTEQRELMTLVLRKLLASSSQAVAGTLATMKARLEAFRDAQPPPEHLVEDAVEDEELGDEYLDETVTPEAAPQPEAPEAPGPPAVDQDKLAEEIVELDRLITWARGIGVDTKSRALLTALEIGLGDMARTGAAPKALVFTESRRTQGYLKGFLEANGYGGRVVQFNGSNTDPESRAIHDAWVAANRDSGRVSGSRQVDIRTALIEHFRHHATVMLSTEAGAEGVNLQFCSLVINYDLPWNPQRIEQRIGRCHRYGQKHDVVVINFLNERNEADKRVLELLTEKLKLFSGVFGASDDVLGAIESGVDFEKRILAIYQTCRTTKEIATAFKALQAELEESISVRLADTRRILLEHFDEDVHARLKVQLDEARIQLDRVAAAFWRLTRFILEGRASFDDATLAFDLSTPPVATVRPGRYHPISKTATNVPGEFLYRLSHPLGEWVLETGKTLETPVAEAAFDISRHATRIAIVEALRGQCGWLVLERLVIESLDREEHLLLSGFGDDGRGLDQETLAKLFLCDGRVVGSAKAAGRVGQRLTAEADRHAEATVARSLEANSRHFREERERLERWADDLVTAAEKELADTKTQIRALTRQARLAATTEEQHETETRIAELERRKRRQRQRIFDVEDEIMAKRDGLIAGLERRLAQRAERTHLFTLRFSVV